MRAVGQFAGVGADLVHAVEQVALSFDGAAGKGDLPWLGVDQCGEQTLRLVAGLRPGGPPWLTDIAGSPIDIAVQGGGHVDAKGMARGVVEIRRGGSPEKIGT